MTLIQRLKNDTALAWAEFEKYYSHEFGNSAIDIQEFERLPIEMQAGVLLSFLESESVDSDMAEFKRINLESSIIDGFITLEDMITHYS